MKTIILRYQDANCHGSGHKRFRVCPNRIREKLLDEISDTHQPDDLAHFQRQFKKKLAITSKFYWSHFVRK